MRSWLKSLATLILVGKSDRVLAHSTAYRILIIGGSNRFIMKDELTMKLTGKIVTNKPGYIYKLGLALTILNQNAGFHSLWRWIQMVFKPYQEMTVDYFIIDYKCSEQDDFEFLAKHFKPNTVILADVNSNDELFKLYSSQIIGLSKALPECLIFAPQTADLQLLEGSKLITYGEAESSDIRLVERREDQSGQTFRYRVGAESGQIHLSTYGVHYIYPILIATYLNAHEVGKKK